MINALVVLSGVLQALGYVIYIRKSLRNEVEPNPTTWLMFAYGTATLTVLEWDRGASLQILLLPIVCATLSIYLAYFCYRRGTLAWPTSYIDRAALSTDVLLTVIYVSAVFGTHTGMLLEETRWLLVVVLIVCSNLSTIVSFVPLIRGALRDPSIEHALPWAVWSSAYAVLGIITFIEFPNHLELLLYPLSNMVLHGSVSLLAIRARG